MKVSAPQNNAGGLSRDIWAGRLWGLGSEGNTAALSGPPLDSVWKQITRDRDVVQTEGEKKEHDTHPIYAPELLSSRPTRSRASASGHPPAQFPKVPTELRGHSAGPPSPDLVGAEEQAPGQQTAPQCPQ